MLSDLWTRLVNATGSLVAPDWGALVALIPVLLLVVVLAFLAITGAKWATAGPARRGPGRRTPLGPDGAPVRTNAAAPLTVAAGVFVAAFGLVAGGGWLAAGIVVVAIGLAWLALDLRRRGAPSSTTAGGTEAAPIAPDRGQASRSRATTLRLVVVLAAITLVAVLVATARVVPDSPAASASSPPGSPAGVPTADATLTAHNIAWVDPSLTAPAGRPFTVAFDNRDSAPHNLEIRDASGTVLFRGDILAGPAVTVYDVPALPAGQYPFICTVHPAMTGTLTVK